jgi:hypothetical protein
VQPAREVFAADVDEAPPGTDPAGGQAAFCHLAVIVATLTRSALATSVRVITRPPGVAVSGHGLSLPHLVSSIHNSYDWIMELADLPLRRRIGAYLNCLADYPALAVEQRYELLEAALWPVSETIVPGEAATSRSCLPPRT